MGKIANNEVGESPRHAKTALGEGTTDVRQLTDAQLLDPRFMRTVVTKMAAQIDTLQLLVGRLFEELEAERSSHAPPAIRHALARSGRRIQLVTVHVDGEEMTVGVRPLGRDDPAEADRRWRLLRDQYGGGRDH
ncbi:hypothetical protein [Nonomuraea roseoviolacea]|uniref:Uncharacterized protein n=1 Tax=Nonomuraea roseoviolacea subsp. carminata TaxID=160689 RepID=A0ABT1K9F0_9ACTN|nr:hypothetical protein [Nonomuraea roseoviolacea]MCP2350575.1 hypothetical protein [Nonomuraea roseoviolacea subsp. carminata]